MKYNKDYPLRLLPNVKKMTIENTGFDKLLGVFGITKTERKITFERWFVNKHNKYLRRQYARLLGSLDNPKKFWAIATFLIERSYTFRAVAINHLLPTWYKDTPLKRVLELNKNVDEMIKTRDTRLQSRRVYIPKKNGKLRPLGVPTLEWRLLTYMHTVMLETWLSRYQDETQHGFRSNRGVHTAWLQILTPKFLNSEDIYEYDLKGFFNSVSLDTISAALKQYDVPTDLIAWIRAVNENEPVYEGEIDEHVQNDPEIGWTKSKLTWGRGTYPFIPYGGWKPEHKKIPGYGTDESVWLDPKAGTPQGLPWSPLLSTLILPYVGFIGRDLEYAHMHQGWEDCGRRCRYDTVAYADDGIHYGTLAFNHKGRASSSLKVIESGIELSAEKSGWIKREGKWLKPITFLGLSYDPETRELRGATRNGSTLLMRVDRDTRQHPLSPEESSQLTKLVLNHSIANREGDGSQHYSKIRDGQYRLDQETGREWFTLLVSRVFNGSWLTPRSQLGTLEWEANTWVDKVKIGFGLSRKLRAALRWRKNNIPNWWIYKAEWLTMVNVSTCASHSLVEILRHQNQKSRARVAARKEIPETKALQEPRRNEWYSDLPWFEDIADWAKLKPGQTRSLQIGAEPDQLEESGLTRSRADGGGDLFPSEIFNDFVRKMEQKKSFDEQQGKGKWHAERTRSRPNSDLQDDTGRWDWFAPGAKVVLRDRPITLPIPAGEESLTDFHEFKPDIISPFYKGPKPTSREIRKYFGFDDSLKASHYPEYVGTPTVDFWEQWSPPRTKRLLSQLWTYSWWKLIKAATESLVVLLTALLLILSIIKEFPSESAHMTMEAPYSAPWSEWFWAILAMLLINLFFYSMTRDYLWDRLDLIGRIKTAQRHLTDENQIFAEGLLDDLYLLDQHSESIWHSPWLNLESSVGARFYLIIEQKVKHLEYLANYGEQWGTRDQWAQLHLAGEEGREYLFEALNSRYDFWEWILESSLLDIVSCWS